VLSQRWLRLTLLVAVFAFGLALRTLGLRMGLPYGHHWDEGWIVDSVIHMLTTRSLVPEHYQYGAPMMMLCVGVYEAFTHLVHDVRPDDGTMLRWIARSVSVGVSATGTVALYLAVRWGDRDARRSVSAGLLAALLYASASELVTHARYGVTDACLVALTAWTLALTARYVRSRHLGWGLASLLAGGCTVAFKISALPTALLPIVGLVWVPGRLRRGPAPRSALLYRALLASAFPVVVATFFALNPMIAHTDHAVDAVRDMVERAAQTRNGGFPAFQRHEPGLTHVTAALWALASLGLHRSPPGSVVLFSVGIGGLAYAIRRRSVFVTLAAAHAGVALVFMTWPNRAFLFRNYLVALPAVCIGFGYGADALARALWRGCVQGRRLSRVALSTAALTTFAALVGLPLRDAIACQALSEDPRERAVHWILAHAPADARVAYTPSVVSEPAMGRYDGFDTRLPRPKVLLPDLSSCDGLRRSRPDFVLTASYRDDNNWVTYEDLWYFRACEGYREVARFDPNPYEHNFAVTPAWNGRTTAIVLQRAER
jgi:hypothetical protein